ncbi:MAG: DoxX family membrane protein [candidate division KSB1 bacterium]|nr:DoxX family membrane protein [candidate division KSB1 bacterium]
MSRKRMSNLLEKTEQRIIRWMSRWGILLLRVSLGIVFFWFGFLKFFPGLSPAQELAVRTISVLTFGLLPAKASILILATWEVLIGIGLMLGIQLRLTLLLLFLQMLGTMTPLVLFPHQVFTRIPYAPTLEGQYIIKNIVIISAGFVIGSTLKKREPN